MIIKSKLQIFAIIAWFLSVSVVTYGTYDEYVRTKRKSPEAKEEKREIVEDYLKAIGLTTGVCLLAWGIPAIPMSYRLFSGQPTKPFSVGNPRRKRKKKA